MKTTNEFAASKPPFRQSAAGIHNKNKRHVMRMRIAVPAIPHNTIHHDYAIEKRQALEAWASELSRIVGKSNAPSNVIELRKH